MKVDLEFGDKIVSRNNEDIRYGIFIMDAGLNRYDTPMVNVMITDRNFQVVNTIDNPRNELARDWRKFDNFRIAISSFGVEAALKKIQDGREKLGKAWDELEPVLLSDPVSGEPAAAEVG